MSSGAKVELLGSRFRGLRGRRRGSGGRRRTGDARRALAHRRTLRMRRDGGVEVGVQARVDRVEARRDHVPAQRRIGAGRALDDARAHRERAAARDLARNLEPERLAALDRADP